MGFQFSEIDIEHKIHLNLSPSARIVIDEDIKNFANGERYNRTGFLNKIFTNFHQSADASVNTRYAEYSSELDEKFSSKEFRKIDTATINKFKDKLLNEYEEKLAEKVNSYQSGEGEKVRVNNENVDILAELIDSEFYNDKVGKYWKALLEEYAQKPMYQREQIYFKEFVDDIESAIAKKHKLKITTIERISSQNETYKSKLYFTPYKILQDKTRSFNYVVGFSEKILENGTISPKVIACIRVSRIERMLPIRSESGRIKEEDQRRIDREIEAKDIQFLLGDLINIKVRFTKKGERDFHRYLYMRPTYYEKVNGEENLYVFTCTEYQAINYFFKFGKDAEILSPSDTREKFIKKYREAYEKYLEE